MNNNNKKTIQKLTGNKSKCESFALILNAPANGFDRLGENKSLVQQIESESRKRCARWWRRRRRHTKVAHALCARLCVKCARDMRGRARGAICVRAASTARTVLMCRNVVFDLSDGVCPPPLPLLLFYRSDASMRDQRYIKCICMYVSERADINKKNINN